MQRAVVDRDRWMALGLLGLALVVAYLALLHPWWSMPMLDVQEQINTLQQRELRQRMQLREAPQIQRQLQDVAQAEARRPGFLTESSAELATAGLVQRLEAVVATASPGNKSCAITNRSPLTDERASKDRFRQVTVQVRMRCGTPELAAALHALESGTPRLFVDNLNVLAQRYFFAPGRGGAQSGGLDVSFDLYGYLRPTPKVPEVPDAR